jgi:hypothetical protein
MYPMRHCATTNVVAAASRSLDYLVVSTTTSVSCDAVLLNVGIILCIYGLAIFGLHAYVDRAVAYVDKAIAYVDSVVGCVERRVIIARSCSVVARACCL